MPDRITKDYQSTAELGSGSGNTTEVLTFDTGLSHGFVQNILIIPRDGVGGTDWEYDVREKNDFTDAENIHSILADDGLSLTQDEHVVHETSATLGKLPFTTERDHSNQKWSHKLYVQIKLNGATATDWTFDVRLDVGREQ